MSKEEYERRKAQKRAEKEAYVRPFWIPNPRDFKITFTVNKEIPQRIITADLSKIDSRQQWQIIFDSNNKKIFKLKNINNNTFLYIAQEPTEGLADFTTIDIDNNNYKYDPAFTYLTQDELDVRTNFNFISSFGTQLDIVDGAKDEISTTQNKLESTKATRVRLTTQPNQPINIFGVFIYSPDGKILNTNPGWAYSSSIYQIQTSTSTKVRRMRRQISQTVTNTYYNASNAIKIVTENPNRLAYDAIQNTVLKGKGIGWNNWHQSSEYCAHTNLDKTGINGGDWWEYEFDDLQDIAVVEIFGRTDCCPGTFENLRIDLFNDKISRTNSIWSYSISKPNSEAHKAVKITKDTKITVDKNKVVTDFSKVVESLANKMMKQN